MLNEELLIVSLMEWGGEEGLTAQMLTILKHLITLLLHNLLTNKALSHTASILVSVSNNSVLNGSYLCLF
jgi:hypothetical protein